MKHNRIGAGFLTLLSLTSVRLIVPSPLSAQEPKPHVTLKGHTLRVDSVTYSPDGKTLASGSYDNTIKLWDVQTGQERTTLKGHTNWVLSVSYSPDGKTLASGSSDTTIKLWDVQTGKVRTTLTGHDAGGNQTRGRRNRMNLSRPESFNATVEISATISTGASDQIKRVVTENATNLGFKKKDWE